MYLPSAKAITAIVCPLDPEPENSTSMQVTKYKWL